MRLIDACALQEAIRTDYFEHFTQYHDTDQDSLIDMVCYDIEESPTVDAVEVVRCKDCRHMEKSQYGRYCQIWGMYNGHGDDGFCCYGELEEGAD